MENLNKNHDHDPELNLPGNYAHGKKNIFQTPSNYFEKLPLEVSDKIQTGKTGVILVPPAFGRVKLILAMAVVACVIAGGVFYMYKSGSGQKSEPVLSSDDLINSGMVNEFDESILVDAYEKLAASTPTTTNADGSSSKPSGTSAEATQKSQSKVVENYLIENNIDITLIINEL